jgi:Na+-driven multidrug efflux pump
MLNLSVSLIIFLVYLIVCLKKYKNLQFFSFLWDKQLFKEIVGFTGWTLLGRLSTVTRNQAVTILLNQTFSPVTVAARAISINITTKINMFSASFNSGLYPPIIKAYAAGDKEDMFKLIFNGSKIAFFLMWVFALPLFLEMQMILNIWLKEVPMDTVLFTRLAIIESLVLAVSLPLTTAARAPGKMKNYELILGSLNLSIFVFAWAILKLGFEAYSVYVVAIVVNIIMFFTRLSLVGSLTGLHTKLYLKKVISPLLLVILLSCILVIPIKILLPESIFYTIVIVLLSVFSSSVSMYYLGLDKEWKSKVRVLILNKFRR